jgi:hypothetical protein
LTRVIILGAGKFVFKAALKLTETRKNHVTVVDADPVRCEKAAGQGIDVVCQDSIDYLADCLRKKDQPDWIVPAVPMHVAFEWINRTLPAGRTLKPLPVPDPIARMLPNPMAGQDGQLYISYADFICPDACPEPAEICSFTGKPRKGILHRTLEQVAFRNYRSVVVHSKQMAPGVGGYRPQALITACRQVLSSGGPVLLSTACKCHGVMHAVSVHRRHL